MKQIKIGIFGANRGGDYISALLANNAEIVAVCDKDDFWLNKAKAKLGEGAAYYSSFDEFIEHPMDAVLLADYFNEHAPFAVRCLEKDIHVLSECTAAGTMAECVALVRAAEKSKAFYMLCENYPHMKFNREIKRICDGGTLGKLLYAEGEYNHPVAGSDAAFARRYKPFAEHWRNFNPATYYVTHSLAPIMYATGATPVRVAAFPVYAPITDPEVTVSSYAAADVAAMISTINDDGSVFRFTGCSHFGAHGNAYRVCGTEGQIENLRGMDGQVMLRYNKWSKPEDAEEKALYQPDWNHEKADLIEKEGHGGGDFLVVEQFLNCILENRKPDFDVYFATTMSAVAILGHRSLLGRGVPYDLPDFRKEEDRVKWEADTLTPYYGPNGEKPTMPCCSNPDYKPMESQLKGYLEAIQTRE